MDRRADNGMQQGLQTLAPLVAVWTGAAALLWLLVGQGDIPYEQLLLDPAQQGLLPWYTGLVSNLGILGWSAAAVASGLGATAASRGSRAGAAVFLRSGATLSALLLLDDLFQLHIVVADALGATKIAFYVLYAGLGSWWAAASANELRRTRWPLLGAAVAALAVSVLADAMGDGRGTALLVEDSAKFLGIVAWATYFVLTTADVIGSLAATGPSPTVAAPIAAGTHRDSTPLSVSPGPETQERRA